MEVCSLDALWTPQYLYMYAHSESSCFGAAEQLSWESAGQHLRRCNTSKRSELLLSVFIRRPQADSRGATSRPPCREYVNAAPRKSMNYLKRKNTAKPIGCSWKYFSCFTFGRSGCLIFRDESNASVVKPFAVTHCDNGLQHFSWINSDSLPVHTHNDLFRL